MAIKKEKKIVKKSATQEVARFSFAMPIMKCFEEVRMNSEGKEVKERFIEGSASSTDIDLHGDQMAPSAIKTMAATLKSHMIGLNAEHDKSWQSDLGDVTKLTVDKKNNLIMRAKLDITSKANDLWYALTTKKKELGLSIGGFVKDYTLEYDKKQEKFKRVYKDIELDHIAVTSTPANPKTWVGAIAKSMDKAERLKELNIFDAMSKEMLIKFIEGSLSGMVGEDNLKKLLTNFSLNINKETLMAIKNKASLKSDELKKKATEDTSKKETSKKDDSELDEETEEATDEQDSEKSDNEAEDTTDEKEEESTDEEATDDEESEEADTDEDDSDEDSDTEEADEEADDSEEEEKALSRKEVSDLVSKGVSDSLKSFFSDLFGKSDKSEKEEDKKDEGDKAEKSKGKTDEDAVSLLKSVISRQDKIEKMLKKKTINRKTTKSVAIDKDEEAVNEEEGVYKTLEDELEAVKSANVNDSSRAFVECGKVRNRWAQKEA